MENETPAAVEVSAPPVAVDPRMVPHKSTDGGARFEPVPHIQPKADPK